MSPSLKILVGMIAVAAMTGLNHGPLGRGAELVDAIETAARQKVAATEVPGIEVRLGREPLSRLATLSGPADPFQREGQGELKGLNDHVRDVDGISAIRWSDGPERTAIPLLLETLILTIAAYLIGLALGWVLWGRNRERPYR